MNIKRAANYYIGGLENALSDNQEGTEDYEDAKRSLSDHEDIVKTVYWMATHELFVNGGYFTEKESAPILNDIRFCGKEWLLAQVEEIVAKQGY